MGSLSVEPHQIFHEDDVEFLWFQKFMSMVVDELLLDRAVEPLAVRIHLRSSRVRVVMREVEFF